MFQDAREVMCEAEVGAATAVQSQVAGFTAQATFTVWVGVVQAVYQHRCRCAEGFTVPAHVDVAAGLHVAQTISLQ